MSAQTSPRRLARTIGALFLLTILAGIFAQGLVSGRLIDFGDAAKTANNILSHRGLFQFGFSVYLIEMTSQVATAALWYVLLRPVSKPIALAGAFIELAGCTVKIFARVLYIAPLWVLMPTASGASPVLRGFTVDQVQSIALVLLKINDYGAATALALFGFSTLLNGFLILRSTFLPRWLGVLGMLCGLGWLTFLYPPLGYRVFMVAALVGLLSAALMIFWLLVFGVNEDRWRDRAGAAVNVNSES
jgi:hypothetical protein